MKRGINGYVPVCFEDVVCDKEHNSNISIKYRRRTS